MCKYNIIAIVICLTISLIYSCDVPAEQVASNEGSLEKVIDSLVQPYVDQGKIAGLAVGVAKNDTILLLKSYGYADLEFDVSLPVTASFEIGSVTKQFTAVAILQLVEKGLISLNDPVDKYISFDSKGREVTIEQLLNHTSGIKGYTEMSSFQGIATQDFPRDTLLRMVEKEAFDFEPGTAMIYSNTGYFMLGLIIEKASGQTYEEYVVENIFSKVGMDNSYYGDERAIRKQRVHGYDTGNEGKLVRAGYLDHNWPYAAGSLCSTVEDLLKWNHMLHTSEKVLKKETYEKLISPGQLNNTAKLRYAKGLMVSKYKGTNVIGHGGGIFGFLSDSRYFPDNGLAIVTLINTTGPVAPAGISNEVADFLLLHNPEESNVKFEGNLSLFSGVYKGRGRGRDMEIKVDASDQRLEIDGGEKKDSLKYVGNGRWSLNDQYYSFVEEEGTIRELHLDATYGFYILKRTE